MEYDIYKLYICNNKGYWDMEELTTLDEVEFEINNLEGFTYYILVGICKESKMEVPLAQGKIHSKEDKLNHRRK